MPTDGGCIRKPKLLSGWRKRSTSRQTSQIGTSCLKLNSTSSPTSHEALCIPGTGLTRYPAAARILLGLLPRLLPKTGDEVSSIINMVCMKSDNGYDLLWHILELTVPGFDPTFPVKIPAWSNDGIFDFAHVFQLYYHLLSKKGDFHDDKMHSTTLLQAINNYAFANLITTLLTCINNYFSVDNDGYLPRSLCIMGLAHQLNKAAKLSAKLILPRAQRLIGETNAWQFDVPIQGSPRVFWMDAGGRHRPPPREGRDGRDNRVGTPLHLPRPCVLCHLQRHCQQEPIQQIYHQSNGTYPEASTASKSQSKTSTARHSPFLLTRTSRMQQRSCTCSMPSKLCHAFQHKAIWALKWGNPTNNSFTK